MREEVKYVEGTEERREGGGREGGWGRGRGNGW